MQSTAEINRKSTVADLVVEDFRNAEIFRKFGIDFCCGGKVSVAEACDKNDLSFHEVLEELQSIPQLPHNTINYDDLKLDTLIDHIVSTHHTYVRESLPMLDEFSTKVARVHGESHPEVVEIFQNYRNVSDELKSHMMKEENILFPYIKEIAAAQDTSSNLPLCPFGNVSNPIRMMEQEHESAGGSLYEIKRLSNNYTPPENACNTYRVLYAKLQEFENNLHEHIHLENNILFPKAIEMENKLLERCSSVSNVTG